MLLLHLAYSGYGSVLQLLLYCMYMRVGDTPVDVWKDCRILLTKLADKLNAAILSVVDCWIWKKHWHVKASALPRSSFDLCATVSLKRCKIGPRLLLITIRKSHTRFRLVPKYTTLVDLEVTLNGRCVLCHITHMFLSGSLLKSEWTIPINTV